MASEKGADYFQQNTANNGDIPPPSYETLENINNIQYLPVGAPMAPKEMYFEHRGRLFTADFYPECVRVGNKQREICPQFEPFSSLVQQANFWLAQNPTFRVYQCETVERDVDANGKIDVATSVRFESAYGMRMNVQGLRLWLFEDASAAGAPPQQIWCLNAMPRPKKSTSFTIGSNFFWNHSYRYGGMVLEDMVPQFEPLDETVKLLNENLRTAPLPGKILTIEQLHVSLSEWSGKDIDLDKSYWWEIVSRYRIYLTCLRIFYIQGPPTQQQIGLQIFLPDGHRKQGSYVVNYENFGDVSTKAMQWVLRNTNGRVTNVQSIRLLRDPPMLCAFYGSSLTPNPQQTRHVAFPHNNVFTVHGLAIGYVTGPGERSILTTGMMSSRIFVPYKIKGRRYESVSETVQRIGDWLSLSASRLVSVDTVEVKHTPEFNNVRHEEMGEELWHGKGNYRLVCYRLYFDGAVDEPPEHLLPPPPTQPKSSSSCTLM